MSGLTLSLAACGSKEDSTANNTQESTTKATSQTTTTQTTTIATTEATTEAARELPEDRAWVDDLYNKIVPLDVDGVVAILNDPELEEKAAPYEFAAYAMWDYKTGYKLITCDEKIVGLIIETNELQARYAFVSDLGDSDDGFDYIDYGDICIYLEGGKSGYFDGKTDHRTDGSTYELNYGEGWMVWHM